MKTNTGVTLMEVLIASVIIALAFIPILRLIDFGSVSTVKVNTYSKGARLAQELIEECKHVPFKVYQNNPNYKNLPDGVYEIVQPDYYKKTQKSIDEFMDQNKQSLKDFGFDAKLKVKRNSLNQIKEIWFEVEIKWRERGKKDNVDQPELRARAGNAIYNSEAM
ncbi:MAG: prepilin-type N-terminal cleavage/methylation domain-containing protein [Candidatus Riflebacteria bacterium]|nr:prepilin-type N-terminal cleavage/methylation domain-containing protein [Candidatus Riflebacteria bacterium]